MRITFFEGVTFILQQVSFFLQRVSFFCTPVFNKIDTVYISTKSNKKLIQAHFNSDLLNLFPKRFHNSALHNFMGSNKLKISSWKFRIKFNKVGVANLTKSFN